MPHRVLIDILERTYADANPADGRRKRLLTALRTNWPDASVPVHTVTVDMDLSGLGPDPYDDALDTDAPGILLRTDFSNDEAWERFFVKFKESEKELLESLRPSPENNDIPPDAQPQQPSQSGSSSTSQADANMDEDEDDEDGDESDDEDASGLPSSIIAIYNPSTPEERSAIANISNLTALGLFNDVDIRPAVLPPPETKTRYNPNNILINKGGWQEIYSGKNIWIYDRKSNEDECARVVVQSGDLYGTATGDSWRARVTHISELQFNMSFLDMKVDFGGLDRWDPQERARNLEEAALV